MWAVAKIKKNQERIFLSELSKKFQKKILKFIILEY